MSLNPIFPQITSPAQAQAEVIVNQALAALEAVAVYAHDDANSTGLTWAYLGGDDAYWGGFQIDAGTLSLTNAATNYIVVARSTGVISVSTSSTNWNDTTSYARAYKVTTAASAVTAIEDHRSGPGGVHGSPPQSSQVIVLPIAVSDETTDLTTGTAKVTFRMPFAMTLNSGHAGARASVTTAPTGADIKVDINVTGSGSIFSTVITIDATEKTSTTAAAPVITDTTLDDDAEITIDIDQIGSTVAGAGLKVYLIGTLT